MYVRKDRLVEKGMELRAGFLGKETPVWTGKNVRTCGLGAV
jgi:hypothetical protein